MHLGQLEHGTQKETLVSANAIKQEETWINKRKYTLTKVTKNSRLCPEPSNNSEERTDFKSIIDCPITHSIEKKKAVPSHKQHKRLRE